RRHGEPDGKGFVEDLCAYDDRWASERRNHYRSPVCRLPRACGDIRRRWLLEVIAARRAVYACPRCVREDLGRESRTVVQETAFMVQKRCGAGNRRGRSTRRYLDRRGRRSRRQVRVYS